MMNNNYSYNLADPTIYSLLKAFAKENKKNLTPSEYALWQYLKRSALGVPFRRQYVIGEFIADFLCLPLKIIIEVDGGYHTLPDQRISDAERTEWLESRGFTVIRFTNEEILGNIENVIKNIKLKINERSKQLQ